MERYKKKNNNDKFRIEEQDTSTKGRVWCQHSPFRIINSGISAAGRMFWSVEFCLRVPTDTAACRSFWPSLLRLLNSSWPFCRDRIPENDVVRTCAHVSVRLGDRFDTTENAFFRAFISLKAQFHLHHHSQRTLTEIASKITANLGLVL